VEKKDEEELDSWSLKHGPVRDMVGYLEGEKRRLFEDKALSFQEYKLYFLRLLFSWSIGLNGNKNLNFLGFVDCIMDESLRA